MKPTSPIFLTVLMVTLPVAVVLLLLNGSSNLSASLQAVGALGAFVVSCIALWYAVKEYDHHKESEKTALLCQYFQRYAADPYIKIVEEYIIDAAKLDKQGYIIGFDPKKKVGKVPSINDKEMFMHFYEEVELLIEREMLNREEVVCLIGYYVGVFDRIKEFHADIQDYTEERFWKYYLRFVHNIPDDFLRLPHHPIPAP